MRALFSQAFAVSRPSTDGAWLPGLAHVLAALTVWPVLGGVACATGLLMTSLVTFVAWLPLTALALNQGQPVPEDAGGPVLTVNARWVLFGAWAATAWVAALLTRG